MVTRKTTYVVLTKFPDGTHYPYYEQAFTAQDAVDAVKCYKDSNEQIDSVFKEVKGWTV